SRGGRLVGGGADGSRATVAATGCWSSCIGASTLSFEYPGDNGVADSTRVPPTTITARMAVVVTYRRPAPRRQRRRPVTAHATSRVTVSVWTAATSDPTRALTTPVARNSWNVSAGIRNWSSRNGTATLRLPKKATSPASPSWG